MISIWIELNEAFAAQALACMRTLELDPAKVNPQGGAIALGHPLGATGAIRVATLVSAMQRDPKIKHGMVTMCIGTGMGFAAVFERVSSYRRRSIDGVNHAAKAARRGARRPREPSMGIADDAAIPASRSAREARRTTLASGTSRTSETLEEENHAG